MTENTTEDVSTPAPEAPAARRRKNAPAAPAPEVQACEPPLDEAIVTEVIALHRERTGDLLGVLEELQHRHPNRYLPKKTLEQVALGMGLGRARIFSVVTFYSFFNLEPQGDHTVMVCRGTACHTRGARNLTEKLKTLLDLIPMADGESFTTKDRKLTVRTVACFGQCALAPIVGVDEQIHGHVTELELESIVKKFMKP